MAINFPDSPSTNDTHVVGDKTWIWNGTYWHVKQGVGVTIWADADSDTKIQVEESSDEDIIRFDTAGTERMTIAANGAVNVGGTLTAGAFSGPLTGAVTGTASVATSVTASANNSTDETVYPAFVDGATGTQGIETDTGLTYNPSSGLLTAAAFAGPLTGNVTGNASGTALTVTQAAQSAITSVGTLTALTVSGDLTVSGTTTTINSTTLTVDDKNIELGSVDSPSDTTADGGGITLKGASDKTILWTNSTDTWDFNQGINVTGVSGFTGTLTVGANTSGHDVKFFGSTSGSYLVYDASEDDLILIGSNLTVSTSNAQILGPASGAASAGNVSYSFSGDTDTGFFRWNTDTFSAATAGATRMTWAADGNVGIGITAPNNTLDVIGDLFVGDTSRDYVGASGYGGLCFPRGEIFFSNTNTQNQLYLMSNITMGADGGLDAINTAVCAYAALDNGTFSVGVAGSTTAGAAPSFTAALNVTNAGNVGIGTASPTYRFQVAHPGTSTQGYFEGGWVDNVNSNSRLIFNDNNFGIGAGQIGSGSNEDDLVLWAYNGAGRGISFKGTSAGSSTTFQSMDAWMRITHDGKVGIGEVSPASDLVVRADSAAGRGGEISIVNYASNTVGNEAALNFGLENSTYAGNDGNFQMKAIVIDGSAATDGVFSNWTGGAFTEHVRFRYNGYVGIGTADPTCILNVSSSGSPVVRIDETGGSGDVYLQLMQRGSNTEGLQFRYASGTGHSYLTSIYSGGHMYLQTANSTRMTITSGGDVGIDVTTPSGRLDLGNGTGRKFYLYHGSGAVTTGLGVDVSGAGYEWSAWCPDHAQGTFKFGKHSGSAFTTLVTFSSAAAGARVTVAGVGTIEGGELSLSGGTSYTQDFYIDRYGNDCRWIWGGVQKVGIQNTGSSYNATNTWGQLSQLDLKQDITDANSQIEDIKAMRFVNYRFKTDVAADGEDAPVLLGVIAEELEAAGMGGLVDEMEWRGDDEETTTVKTAKMSIISVKAVKALQELIARVEALESA